MNELKINKTQEFEILPNKNIIENEFYIPYIFNNIINKIYDIGILFNELYIKPNNLLEQLTLKNPLFFKIYNKIIDQLDTIKYEIEKMIKNKNINQFNIKDNIKDNILIQIKPNVSNQIYTDQINLNFNYLNLHRNINIIKKNFIKESYINRNDSISSIIPSSNIFQRVYIKYIYSLSNGNIIVISSLNFKTYASLYTYKNYNFIELDYLHILGYYPKVIYELKNKTIVFSGIDHIAFYKIKKNKIYRSSYHHTDHNGQLINEILQIKELEKNKIILLNKKGNIYIIEKIKKNKKAFIKSLPNGSLEIDGQVIDGIPEYIFTGIINNKEIEIISTMHRPYKIYYRMIFDKNNVIYFSNNYFQEEFNIDFSNDKYIINKKNIFKRYLWGVQNFTFEFDDEFVFSLYNDESFTIINKNTIELVAFYEMDKENTINQIIKIEKNYYLCFFSNYDIGLIDFRDKDLNIKKFKIIEIPVFMTICRDQILLINY